MSFFRNLFSSVTTKFPEYPEFVTSVDALRVSGASVIDSTMSAFSDDFSRFVASQPGSLKPGLETVKKAGDDQARSMRHLWNDLSKLSADLDCLRVKNLEFQAKQKEIEAVRERAKASVAAVPKAQEALDRAERRGNQAEIKRLADRLEQAKKTAEEDEAAAAAGEAAWEEFQKRYPPEFTDLVSATLEPAVDAKLKELDALGVAAESFLEAAEGFEDFDDPALEGLRKRLEELNSIVVEE
jgi:predicted RNase H-like nuclease (RuvC/YqgF family)